MSEKKNIVQMELLQVLRFIKLGIQNGNYDSALDVLNDLIQQVEERKEKGEQVRL